jgi:hypothetical protein
MQKLVPQRAVVSTPVLFGVWHCAPWGRLLSAQQQGHALQTHLQHRATQHTAQAILTVCQLKLLLLLPFVSASLR